MFFLYSAVYIALDRSKTFYISGKLSATLQLLREDYSLTCSMLYVARYSFIQVSELRRRGGNENI